MFNEYCLVPEELHFKWLKNESRDKQYFFRGLQFGSVFWDGSAILSYFGLCNQEGGDEHGTSKI